MKEETSQRIIMGNKIEQKTTRRRREDRIMKKTKVRVIEARRGLNDYADSICLEAEDDISNDATHYSIITLRANH